MKNILLLEDRKERQKIFLQSHNISANDLSENIENKLGDQCNDLLKMIKLEPGKIDHLLKDYKIVIAHRSAIVEYGIYNNFIKYLNKARSIAFVVFSGGINGCTYSNENFPFLLLNSRQFYSKNLIEFAKKPDMDLSYLIYGPKWKLNYFIRLSNLYMLSTFEELQVDASEIEQLETMLSCNRESIQSKIQNEINI